jgi:hypothetical protein
MAVRYRADLDAVGAVTVYATYEAGQKEAFFLRLQLGAGAENVARLAEDIDAIDAAIVAAVEGRPPAPEPR